MILLRVSVHLCVCTAVPQPVTEVFAEPSVQEQCCGCFSRETATSICKNAEEEGGMPASLRSQKPRLLLFNLVFLMTSFLMRILLQLCQHAEAPERCWRWCSYPLVPWSSLPVPLQRVTEGFCHSVLQGSILVPAGTTVKANPNLFR